jgi:hypothetical protein
MTWRAISGRPWSKIVRVGDDGDTCFLGFADTTLLDLVSRVGPNNISRHVKLFLSRE